MEYWEFLLQQEGDRIWLPLESPNVEILEGRYRIVARSSRINTNVEIRISHEAIDEVPPKRRIQKRMGRTNREGLMVVIPYTRLQAGIWHLSCLGDVMSDFMGDNWKYTVNLQVLPSEAEMEEWETPWHPLDDSAEDSAEFKLSKDSSAAVLGTASRWRETLPKTTISAISDASVTSETAPSEAIAAIGVNPNAASNPLPAPEAILAENVAEPDAMSQSEVTPPSLTDVDPEISRAIGSSMEQFLDVAEQMSQHLVNQVFQSFDQETGLNTIPTGQTLVDRETSDNESEAYDFDAPDHVLELASTATGLTLPTQLNLDADSAIDRETEVDAADANTHDWDAVDLGTVASVPTVSAATRSMPARSLSLSLDQPAYVAHRGQPLLLSGQITEAEPTAFSDPWMQSSLLSAELHVSLQDPQSSAQLVEINQPISAQSLPYAFSCALEMPADLQTRLALGEVVLYSTVAPGTALVAQSFTVTVDVDELLGELAQINQLLKAETESTDKLELPLEMADQPMRSPLESDYLKLSFLSSEDDATAPRSSPFPFLAGHPLPPQLYQPDPAKADRKGLDLPQFRPLQDNEPVPADSAEVNDTAEMPSASDEIMSSSETSPFNPEIETFPPDASHSKRPTVSPLEREIPAFGSQDEAFATRKPTSSIKTIAELQSLSPETIAFRSLRLQERFWTRLNSLASDAELSEWLRNNLQAAGVSLPPRWATSSAPVTSLSENLATHEFVVEDEPPTPVQNLRDAFGQSQRSLQTEAATAASSTSAVPDVEPVPTPILEVTTQELISGEPVTVRVRLPRPTSRIYVKLWINDCQTRLLLDGPRLLTDFLPMSSGELEATVQLTVPYGSLEIRFEAIALDMQTQRESHKTTVIRHIMPPGLPNSSMDEFEP
jgi:hypothetical protein